MRPLIISYDYVKVRGSQGEHTKVKEGLMDLSNKKRLGITEFHLVRKMVQHCSSLHIPFIIQRPGPLPYAGGFFFYRIQAPKKSFADFLSPT
jgi:ATP:guanido phosphotransferase, C-terminal catalytic domain